MCLYSQFSPTFLAYCMTSHGLEAPALQFYGSNGKTFYIGSLVTEMVHHPHSVKLSLNTDGFPKALWEKGSDGHYNIQG